MVFEKSGEKGRSKKERLNVLLKELFMAQILLRRGGGRGIRTRRRHKAREKAREAGVVRGPAGVGGGGSIC
jgi:hypothetical protein